MLPCAGSQPRLRCRRLRCGLALALRLLTCRRLLRIDTTLPRLCNGWVATECFGWCRRGTTWAHLSACSRNIRFRPVVTSQQTHSSVQGLQIRVAHSFDDLDLAVEACGAALDQGHVGRETHLVDMSPRIQIVQRIEDQAEALKPRDVELAILDVVVVRCDAHVRVEPAGRLFRNLLNRQRMLYRPSYAGIVAIPMPWTS